MSEVNDADRRHELAALRRELAAYERHPGRYWRYEAQGGNYGETLRALIAEWERQMEEMAG